MKENLFILISFEIEIFFIFFLEFLLFLGE